MFRVSIRHIIVLAIAAAPVLASSVPSARKSRKPAAEEKDSIILPKKPATGLKSKKQLVAERAAASTKPLPVSYGKFSGLNKETQVRVSAAVKDLKKAGVCPTITSAFRSSTQQQALYKCAHKTKCKVSRGIYSARKPGTSLHEAGLAVDVADVAAGNKHKRKLTTDGKKIVKIMKKHGFNWRYGLKDPAHFELDPKVAGYRSEKQAIAMAQKNHKKPRSN